MDPDSCGCIPFGDGQLYQPVTCSLCGGSMRVGCGHCGGTGSEWYPCTHRQLLGMQVALSAGSQGGASYGYKKSSKGGGSSQGQAAVVSQGL
ncbi:hypothetical protein C8A00DRAFT_15932 [Chaetomidium leptoderma]|uniref:Uncharacterized protein n=1 Tax=Chaetomidium leptoderma TaxID=669021 RepID=A0AAN6VM17_9PEZI|nr:hypothetical protein C8A00DRAFT_15932 [Chaetomidium leptoderma]